MTLDSFKLKIIKDYCFFVMVYHQLQIMVRVMMFFILLSPTIGWGQIENIVLEGIVINEKESPIPFATIQIKNKSIGISANDEGQFRFVIPSYLRLDTLRVSSIGYSSSEVSIASIGSDAIQTILLKEASVMLEEVIVKDIAALEILKQAILRMDDHFDNNPYSMESFFRIAVKKDSAYIGLLDAAIDIHDRGFNKKGGLSADLLQLRKIVYTDNWFPGSGLSFRSPAVSIEEEFHKRIKNGILTFSKARKFWDIELVETAQQDNDLYYILKARPKRATVNFPYYFATLQIRASDYAIMHVAYDYYNNLINFSKQFPATHPYGGYMSDKTLLDFSQIKGEFNFTEYHGKLYLSRAFYEETGRLSNALTNVDFDYQGSFEIFVNRIFHERTGQASKPISKHDDIFKLTDQYDSIFWSNYNKPIFTNLYEKVISNMKQNGDLKEQFQYFTSHEIINKEYLLSRRMQSDHFVFNYSTPDTAVINSIINTLETNYRRVTEDLKSFDQPVVTVKIYPTLDTYHRSIGGHKFPSWMIGSSFGADEFRIVSPQHPGPAHTYQSVLQALVHEFTHCVHGNIIDDQNPVRWLWESIACYESNQFINPENLKYIKAGDYPTLRQMSNDEEKGYVYELGFVLIEYIKVTWGKEKLVDLLRSNADLPGVLGIAESKLEEGFYSYIKSKYLRITE